MPKLQTLKRETVGEIYGTIDYRIELSCGHRTRVARDQLRGPERVWCYQCPDDAEHAKTSAIAPLRNVLELINDPDDRYVVRLECGHWLPSKTMYKDRLPKRRRCPGCLTS
jgi:hypothetical protein